MHLERDMRWNGPHDEEFFRCFEQQLDIALSRFVRQLKIQRKEEGNHQRQESVVAMLDEQRGQASPDWSTPLQNKSLDLASFNDHQRQSPLERNKELISTNHSQILSPKMNIERLSKDGQGQGDEALRFGPRAFQVTFENPAAQTGLISPVRSTNMSLGNSHI